MTPAQLISEECDQLKEMLLAKNRSYGNSALEPLRIFSKADPVEQIKVRLDDKLSRLARGDGQDAEDTILDLLGYLILLRVSERMAKRRQISSQSIQKANKRRNCTDALFYTRTDTNTPANRSARVRNGHPKKRKTPIFRGFLMPVYFRKPMLYPLSYGGG